MFNNKELSFYWALFGLLGFSFYPSLKAVIITPKGSIFRLQVSYNTHYQGIVIEPLQGIDPESIDIVALKIYGASGKSIVTGSSSLDEIAGRAIMCSVASWLPWSKAEYHILAYARDPGTKKRQKRIKASDVIAIRHATKSEIEQAFETAKRLKYDIYAPLFLQSKIKKSHVAAGTVVTVGAVCALGTLWDAAGLGKKIRARNAVTAQRNLAMRMHMHCSHNSALPQYQANLTRAEVKKIIQDYDQKVYSANVTTFDLNDSVRYYWLPVTLVGTREIKLLEIKTNLSTGDILETCLKK